MLVKRIGKNLFKYWRVYKTNHLAVGGLAIVIFFLIIGIVAPVITPFSPLRTAVGKRLMLPSLQHPMGTDGLGRDIWSGWVWGARTALIVAGLASTLATVIGILVGSISGYFGGRLDTFLMRIVDLFLMLPTLILALVIVSLFGATVLNIIFVIALLGWPSTARLIRAEFLRLRELEFVEAARTIGAGNRTIIFSEILPNAVAPSIVNASIQAALAILLESGMSFIGLSDPNMMSWGKMLSDAQSFTSVAWWYAFFPGLAISLIALAFNLIGDGLNETLKPGAR